MDQWLIRTSQNQILPARPRQEIIRLIESGELISQDEVCQANGYWFFLHEQDEVTQQLGIDICFIHDDQESDEVTEVQTEDTEVEEYATKSAEGGVKISSKGRKLIPIRSQLSKRIEVRELGVGKPQIFGAIEKPSLLKFVIIVLVMLILVILGAVFYKMQ